MTGQVETRMAGLIGMPVGHSLSPVLHEAAYAELDIPWGYGLFECPDERAATERIGRGAGERMVGLNVTMPWKRLALSQATIIDDSARAAGGANVLTFLDGEVLGSNTDGAGIVATLSREGGCTLEGGSFLVCGTGATAGAAASALVSGGASLVFCMSRTADSARRFVTGLSLDRLVPTTYAEALDVMAEVTGIVDATPVGMHAGELSVLPAEGFSERHVVLDMVYAHGLTDILRVAGAAGARTLDGLGVLVEQAALTVETWTEVHLGEARVPSRVLMRQAAERELARRSRSAAEGSC